MISVQLILNASMNFNILQLHSDTDFKLLVEKAAYSQHHRCTMRHRPVASPGYTVSVWDHIILP